MPATLAHELQLGPPRRRPPRAAPSRARGGRPRCRRRTRRRPRISTATRERRAGAEQALGRASCRSHGLGHGSRTKNASAVVLGRRQRRARVALAVDARGPAGGAGAGGDDQAGRGLALARARRRRARSAPTGGVRVPDEHLVEREQLLAVVERAPRPSCGAAARARPAATSAQQVGGSASGAWATSTPASARVRVEADHRLARRGTWRRWRPARPGPSTTTTSSGSNRKRSSSARCTAARRQSAGSPPSTARARRLAAQVALLDVLERAAALRRGRSAPARACRDARAARGTRSGARPGRARGIIAHAAQPLQQRGEQVGRDVRCSIEPGRPAPCSASASSTSARHRGLDLRALALGRAAARASTIVDVARPRASAATSRRRSSAACLGLRLRPRARRAPPRGARARSGSQLVLGDRPLLLDGERAAGERRLVGVCWIASRVGWLQRLLDLGASARPPPRARRRPRCPSSPSAGSPRQPGGDAVADRRDAAGEDRAHVELDELVDHELLGELGEQRRDLLERRLRPRPVREVDREVDAPRERRGSATRKVIAPWTVSSWKSARRTWNRNGSSRSSIGTSATAVWIGRNQNASPAPSRRSSPRR